MLRIPVARLLDRRRQVRRHCARPDTAPAPMTQTTFPAYHGPPMAVP